jgi:hypothetical protein
MNPQERADHDAILTLCRRNRLPGFAHPVMRERAETHRAHLRAAGKPDGRCVVVSFGREDRILAEGATWSDVAAAMRAAGMLTQEPRS